VKFIKNRRAAKLLIGIFFMLVIYFISSALEMHVLSFMLAAIFQVGILALIILFQPELRSLLEKVGGTSIHSINRIVDQKNAAKLEKTLEQISKSAAELSASKHGALIVIERTTKLGDVINSGIIMRSEVSSPLIRNIFYDKAPLHDGAVIIGSELLVEAAGCRLPLSESEDLGELGMRHRAGLGISENSDAAVIIVSEETGIISLALDGRLERNFDLYSLKRKLNSIFIEGSAAKGAKPQKSKSKAGKRGS